MLIISFIHEINPVFGNNAVSTNKPSPSKAKSVPVKKENKTEIYQSLPGEISWQNLKDFDLKTKKPGPAVQKLANKNITILGFLVPLDFDEKSIKEFVIIPTPMSCMHVPPPPPSQMILAKSHKNKKVQFYMGPVYLKGKLTLANPKDPDAPVYFIDQALVEPYTGKAMPPSLLNLGIPTGHQD